MYFQVQTNPKESKITFYRFLCVIVHEFSVLQDSKFVLQKTFTDVRCDLINGIILSWGANRHIFKFKQALKQEKQDFTHIRVLYPWTSGDIILHFLYRNFHGRPL